MRRSLLLVAVVMLAVAAHAQAPVAYPNPLVSGALTVETADAKATFGLIDLLGRCVGARGTCAMASSAASSP